MHEVLVNCLGGLSCLQVQLFSFSVGTIVVTLSLALVQGCHGQGKKSGKGFFFTGQGKIREFCEWPGKFRKDLESQGKVMEFENKWLWQSSENLFRCHLFILCIGERMYFLMRYSMPISLLIWGYFLRKEF